MTSRCEGSGAARMLSGVCDCAVTLGGKRAPGGTDPPDPGGVTPPRNPRSVPEACLAQSRTMSQGATPSSPPANLNEVARSFLETYERGSDVDGGWKFSKALQQARLDFSAGSLRRLDLLLAAIRERAKPVRDEFTASPQGRNFCSLVAFYLVAHVARTTGAHLDWFDASAADRVLPPGVRLPEGSASRMFAHAPDQGAAFLPLAWVEDSLFGTEKARPPRTTWPASWRSWNATAHWCGGRRRTAWALRPRP